MGDHEEPDWIVKARQTYSFHRSKRLVDNKWTMVKTAKALRRSIGSVSEDIMIVKWLKTHENQLKKYHTAYEALEFIREKKKNMDLEEAS